MSSLPPHRAPSRAAAAWLAVALLVPSGAGGETGDAAASRLADAKSPYLLLHADNPVEWYPWGEEAFAKAKAEDKPIFLSVGYSTCYWCHVAERTLYSDPAIAELMNRWFVNVKVDREQHPDVDALYMLARQLLDDTGGWPNNVFLTPDLAPFFAGSYFPPDDDGSGRPDFPRVLRALHEAWSTRRDEVVATAAQVRAGMGALHDPASAVGAAPIAPAALLSAVTESYLEGLDPRHGGQRSGADPSKFPQSPMLVLMLASYRESGNAAVLRALTATLDAMALGGIHDHLAGGFHRYATEPTWSVPHFEKMLDDNAQLLAVYSDAYRTTGKPLYRYVAENVAEYLLTRMMSPRGAFFTAQDAQVDGVEGASYRWRREEVETILGGRGAERFFSVYELVAVPEMAGGTGHGARPGGALRVRLPIDETLRRAGFDEPVAMLTALAPLRRRLLAARDARPQPLRDEKIVVDVNALAIEGLVASSAALGRPEHLEAARRAAERIWRLAYDARTGRLMHQIFRGEASIGGYASDYAQLGLAFLALETATGEAVWRERAVTLADRLLARFTTPGGGLAMAAGGANLPSPVHSLGDDARPSGTSAAIELLLRLGDAASGARHREAGQRLVAYYSGWIAGAPAYWPSAVRALASAAQGTTAGAAPASATASERPRLPESADRVKVSARASAGPGEGSVVVTLTVENGYHVNANPASLEYLIPTSVAFEGVTPARIRYPEATSFRPSFSSTAIRVYEGEKRVTATFPEGTLRPGEPVAAVVTVQACDDKVCLAPSRIPVSATPAAEAP